MDKTTKLIFWQRVTIGVMLFVSIFSMCQVHLYKKSSDKSWQKAQSLEDALNTNSEESEKIIADLDKQLKKYEKRYGYLPREGEGSVFVKERNCPDSNEIGDNLQRAGK